MSEKTELGQALIKGLEEAVSAEEVKEPVVYDLELEQPKVDPAKFEAALLQNELSKDIGSPADLAAAFFDKHLFALKTRVNMLSLRQLKRVMMSVASYPFAKVEYEPRSGIEKEVAYHFDQLIHTKAIMQLEFEREKVLKAMEDEEKNKTELSKGDNENV